MYLFEEGQTIVCGNMEKKLWTKDGKLGYTSGYGDFVELAKSDLDWKHKMKPINCMGCGNETEVYDSYEPQMCCSGHMCGCMGMPVNPVFCDECEEKVYGKRDYLRSVLEFRNHYEMIDSS